MKFLWKIFLLCILFIVMAGCSGSSDGNSSSKGMHSVRYEVSTSTDDASITFLDENGESVTIPQQDTHSSIWSYTFEAKNGAHLSLTAQLLGESEDNTIYVTIYVDALSKFQQSSFGKGVSAHIEYDIPMTD
jgi:hypothetical protein